MKRQSLSKVLPLVTLAIGLSWLPAISQASPITTLFGADNFGNPGGAVYFDLTVGVNAITITGLDTNTRENGVFSGFEFYTTSAGSSAFGNEGNIGAWTLQTTGTLTASGLDNPSPVNLMSSVLLSANTTYGIALVMPGQAGHAYTNGTGSNQNYANADLSLTFGTATSGPFVSCCFDPRVWNGSIYYTVDKAEPPPQVPAPGALGLLGIALAGLGFTRRRKQAV
ncbi:MAG: PEP-CTERM sorting domain-containing protein [Pseudomonadales bacterium]|nr:MAG: PEP-CTERM sorting domain-containing protein [Pseudomonadales bacterium]